jgi:hypothetical protein
MPLTISQDLQEQVAANSTLREQLEQAKKETSEKGSVCLFNLLCIPLFCARC